MSIGVVKSDVMERAVIFLSRSFSNLIRLIRIKVILMPNNNMNKLIFITFWRYIYHIVKGDTGKPYLPQPILLRIAF